MENEKNKGTRKNIIIAILSILLLVAGGYIGYDKVLKSDKEQKNIIGNNTTENLTEFDSSISNHDSNTTTCNCTSDNLNYGEKINKFKEMKLTTENQTIKIGNREFKVKIDNLGYLYINDYSRNFHVAHAYLTDKFMMFTISSQDGETFGFGLGEKGLGEIIANDNEYQMHNFKLVDGYLHASGHIFCGLDGNCPDRDLIIKYIDNTLIVVPA